MLDIVQQLFCQMNENIKYVHFKSNEHLLEGLNGKTDLDLLVYGQDKEKMKIILNMLCFVLVISPKEQEYKDVEHWMGFDEETGKLIHLHIYYKLITGKTYIKEIVLDWDETAYKTSGFYLEDAKEVRIVSSEFEMLLLLTRTFYKASCSQRLLYNINFTKHISPDVVREYEFLRKRLSVNKLETMLKELFPHIDDLTIKRIIKYLSDNNLCELYKSIKKTIVIENNFQK